jgi:hypothetical protein
LNIFVFVSLRFLVFLVISILSCGEGEKKKAHLNLVPTKGKEYTPSLEHPLSDTLKKQNCLVFFLLCCVSLILSGLVRFVHLHGAGKNGESATALNINRSRRRRLR